MFVSSYRRQLWPSAGSSCESGLSLEKDRIPVHVFLFTGTGSRRVEPVSRNRGTGAFGTRAVYRRLGLRLWKQDLHWKQRIQNKHVHSCIANPCIDKAEQKKICSLVKPVSIRWATPESTFFPLFQACLWVTALCWKPPVCLPQAQDRWLTLISSRHHFVSTMTMAFKFFSAICSNQLVVIKNSHLLPFPCSVHSQIHSHFSLFPLFPPPFLRDPAPTEQAPSHPHTPLTCCWPYLGALGCHCSTGSITVPFRASLDGGGGTGGGTAISWYVWFPVG